MQAALQRWQAGKVCSDTLVINLAARVAYKKTHDSITGPFQFMLRMEFRSDEMKLDDS